MDIKTKKAIKKWLRLPIDDRKLFTSNSTRSTLKIDLCDGWGVIMASFFVPPVASKRNSRRKKSVKKI